MAHLDGAISKTWRNWENPSQPCASLQCQEKPFWNGASQFDNVATRVTNSSAISVRSQATPRMAAWHHKITKGATSETIRLQTKYSTYASEILGAILKDLSFSEWRGNLEVFAISRYDMAWQVVTTDKMWTDSYIDYLSMTFAHFAFCRSAHICRDAVWRWNVKSCIWSQLRHLHPGFAGRCCFCHPWNACQRMRQQSSNLGTGKVLCRPCQQCTHVYSHPRPSQSESQCLHQWTAVRKCSSFAFSKMLHKCLTVQFCRQDILTISQPEVGSDPNSHSLFNRRSEVFWDRNLALRFLCKLKI